MSNKTKVLPWLALGKVAMSSTLGVDDSFLSLRSLPPTLVPHSQTEALGEGIVASPGLRAQTPELQELPCERITGPEGPRNQNIGPGRWFKSRWRGHRIPNEVLSRNGSNFIFYFS